MFWRVNSDWLVGKCPKVRGDGCPHTGFPLFPLIRHLPKILAEPQGGATEGGAALRHGRRLGG
ncbi:MAG: hypothetical protein CVV03_03530 [Firmicutes bacterium HGW-Firmicutes-8]|nr:MAG: hypothetical protein CVV03_03530 [Firmicutes bacterium HGW-Firmicutes-8]